jgi:hypothetical protein
VVLIIVIIFSKSCFSKPTYKGKHKIFEAIDSEIGMAAPFTKSIEFKEG